jgi:hypothetical protein
MRSASLFFLKSISRLAPVVDAGIAIDASTSNLPSSWDARMAHVDSRAFIAK